MQLIDCHGQNLFKIKLNIDPTVLEFKPKISIFATDNEKPLQLTQCKDKN